MPGIAGVISRQPAHSCERMTAQMIASMQHEKFHVSGSYSAPELGAFVGWVSLEDSFADSQPIIGDRGDVILFLSGECFSDQNVHATPGQIVETDATWLVRRYEEKGDAFFEALNGTFSGLLIDLRQRKAALFNDRYGLERIYYYEGRDGFFFASEAKALLKALPQLREFDNEGVARFLTFGCTTDTRTLFRDINLLPGGSLWCFQACLTQQWTKR